MVVRGESFSAVNFDLSTFRLNSPLGKRILAAAREGNYAHPGEEEAIRMTLAGFSRDPSARWLDAGCGRGGTADFVRRMGWAGVTAFDVDAVSIEEARRNYPGVQFFACGVTEAPAVIGGSFDLIYAFNAFYAFPDQPAALAALRSLAGSAARLVIFDYVDRGGFYETAFSRRVEAGHWRPVDERRFADSLSRAGWRLADTRNLDADYDRWYADLGARFRARRPALEAFAPPEAVDYAAGVYEELRATIRAGALGGATFVAEAG